mmetsp:Transcript_85328/g.275372  ORF Transcript_85328/g.275372 Transcript_85328/m.275372 type:complete len:202 (-) Transcript_85328:212-817(-)
MARQNLRRHVSWRAYKVPARLHACRQAEIDHLEVGTAPSTDVPCEHHVLRLDVPVNDVAGVAAIHSDEQLLHQPRHSDLTELLLGLSQEAAAIAAGDIFEDEHQTMLGRVVGVLVELDDGRVVQIRQHLDFRAGELQDLLGHLPGVHDFADTLVARAALAHELDAAEASPPDLADHLVVPADEVAGRVPGHRPGPAHAAWL